MTKILITNKDPFDTIVSTVRQAAKMVAPTYGPAGHRVIIDKSMWGMIVDDGVQILRDLALSDPNENAVLKAVRETAIKTNDRAGDGTTGSIIMLQEIILGVADLSHRRGHKIEAELKAASKEAVEQLRAQAQKVVTKEDLLKVARVSFNDADIAEVIADTWHKVGPDGIVTLEGSLTAKTVAEIAEGISIRRGYIAPQMVTHPERMEAIVDKPFILVTDYRLTEANDVLPIMNLLAGKNILNLVIIAEHIEGAALATLVINKIQGKFNAIAISAPPADNVQVALDDIAILVGAKFFSQKKGDKLETARIEDLGKAQRFVSRRDNSVIIKPKGSPVIIKKAIADLQSAIDVEQNPKQKESLRARLGFFTGKVAIIKVGGETDNEQKAKKYKVEDAVNAVRSAYRGGVVAGGGVGLASIKTSSALLNRALARPQRQLLENMEIDEVPVLKKGEALNVITMQTGPWMKVGVLDPADVLIAAVESAVSIACILVSVSGMLVEVPDEPKQ